MILDTHNECHEVNFNIGGSTSYTRVWEIRVTQYTCGSEDVAGNMANNALYTNLTVNSIIFIIGWPGCLQYYTQTFNTIQKYAFVTLTYIYTVIWLLLGRS